MLFRSLSAAGIAGEGAVGGQEGMAEGVVELATYLGAVREHVVRVGAGPGLRLVVREPTSDGGGLQAPGSTVAVRWSVEAQRLFGADGAPVPDAGAPPRDATGAPPRDATPIPAPSVRRTTHA